MSSMFAEQVVRYDIILFAMILDGDMIIVILLHCFLQESVSRSQVAAVISTCYHEVSWLFYLHVLSNWNQCWHDASYNKHF